MVAILMMPAKLVTLGLLEIKVMQKVSRKIKTDDVFPKLGNQTTVYQRSQPWLATNFFCYNSQNTRKCYPGREIF